MTDGGEATALDRSLARVLDALAHDLKNPLAAVIGNLRFLEGERLDDAVIEAAREAIEAAETLHQRLENALDLQRARLGQLVARSAPTELAQLEQTLRHRVASRLGSRTLLLDLPQRQVTIDGELLRQLLAVLLEHGLRHTPPGRSVSLRGELSAGELHLELVDEGLPFCPDRQPSLVADNYQSGEVPEGYRSDRGLALMFVGAVVRSLGGTAAVTSPVTGGKGARFHLTIPC
jgi:two-component system sensor histidine kinase KdpD